MASQSQQLELKSSEKAGLIKQLESESDQVRLLKSDMQELRNTHSVALQTAQQQLSTSERSKAALAEQILSTASSVDSGHAEIVKLKQQLEEMTSKIQSDDVSAVLIAQLKEDKSSLEKQLNDAETKSGGQLKAVREELDSLRDELVETNRKLEQAQQSVEVGLSQSTTYRAQTDETLRSMKETLLLAEQKHRAVTGELAQAMGKAEEVERERDALLEQVQEKSAQKATLLSEKTALEGRIADLDSSVSGLESQVKTSHHDSEKSTNNC